MNKKQFISIQVTEISVINFNGYATARIKHRKPETKKGIKSNKERWYTIAVRNHILVFIGSKPTFYAY